MMREYPIFHTYIWMKKKRWEKKIKIYRQVFHLLFDWTISVYLALFAVLGLIILRDWIHQSVLLTAFFSSFTIEWVVIFFLGWVALQTVHSFRDPGVYISSSEYQLGLLPYPMRNVWFYAYLEQVIYSILMTVALFSLLTLLTPLDSAVVMLISISFLIGKTSGILVKWRLFQMNLFTKALIVALVYLVLFALRILFYFLDLPVSWLLGGGWLLVMFAGLLLFYQPLYNIDWGKVVSYSDARVWRMWIVQQITKTHVKPARRYQFLQRFFQGERARKPFPYEMSAISFRMWRSYLKDQMEPILQSAGAVYIAGVALNLQGNWGAGIGLAVGIFIFNQMASAVFMSHFSRSFMFAIPWEVAGWAQSFRKWYVFAVVMFLPLVVWGFDHHHFMLMITATFLIMVWMYLDLQLAISGKFNNWLNRSWDNGPIHLARGTGFVSLAVSGIFLWGIYMAVPLLFLLIIRSSWLSKSWFSMGNDNAA